ncbi:MAG TPA: lysophospholipid acyltransferase family protein [Gemmatimonadaceae bacterium]|nr:lysophospholipid acyltransferase family protein [Gemmatimonadaceae bacterium]
MSAASDERRLRWIATAGGLVLRALAHTWRVRFINPEIVRELRDRNESWIFVLWHHDILPLVWTHRHRNVSVMISEHRDGELIARIAQSLGFRTVRGSTSRGAARALLEASREAESGHTLAITVDGPRGPRHSVAPGALVIAQRAGKPMVPATASASRAWTLKSWDRFVIPKPFARVIIAYGSPIRIAADSARDAADADQIERVRSAIDAAASMADAMTTAR